MGLLGVVADASRFVAFGLIVATVVLAFLAHRRSRATVFTQMLLTASLLMLALLYLAYVYYASGRLPGDREMYAAGVGLGYMLVAGFFLSVGIAIWRHTRRTEGAIIVSPDFLSGLRTRTAAMYGDSPSRFIVYAVGKESAEKSMRRYLSRGRSDPAAIWARLPRWSRALGYGSMRVVDARIGDEVRVQVDDTIESLQPGGVPGCDMTRGYLAGLGSAVHPDKDCECVEARCGRLATPPAPCEFTLHWFPREGKPTVPVATPVRGEA